MWCARAFSQLALQWLKWLIGIAYARRHLSNGQTRAFVESTKRPLQSTSKHSMMDGTILHTNSGKSPSLNLAFHFFLFVFLVFLCGQSRRGKYVYRASIDKGMKRVEVEVGIVNLWNVNFSRTDVYGEQIEWAEDIEATGARVTVRQTQITPRAQSLVHYTHKQLARKSSGRTAKSEKSKYSFLWTMRKLY